MKEAPVRGRWWRVPLVVLGLVVLFWWGRWEAIAVALTANAPFVLWGLYRPIRRRLANRHVTRV